MKAARTSQFHNARRSLSPRGIGRFFQGRMNPAMFVPWPEIPAGGKPQGQFDEILTTRTGPGPRSSPGSARSSAVTWRVQSLLPTITNSQIGDRISSGLGVLNRMTRALPGGSRSRLGPSRASYFAVTVKCRSVGVG